MVRGNRARRQVEKVRIECLIWLGISIGLASNMLAEIVNGEFSGPWRKRSRHADSKVEAKERHLAKYIGPQQAALYMQRAENFLRTHQYGEEDLYDP